MYIYTHIHIYESTQTHLGLVEVEQIAARALVVDSSVMHIF